jgi:glycosyltransferase involved in cell wall biosynthesis
VAGKYFFALGSRSYHKNFKWIVEAAKQNPQYRFVVSGTNSLSTSDTALDTKLDNLIYAGYLSDEQVKALMTHCKAFLQPSLYEGFGIPPLEAMSTGARCIVSNTTSLPEIYGDSVWYIDPLDYQDINIDKIMSGKIEDNYEVRNKYSWRRSACKLYALMEHISEK